jgi:hypothetical protein
MWKYRQIDGAIRHDGPPMGYGYSGHPPYVNDPASERILNEGVIPRGSWTIGEAVDDPKLGPFAMPLTPYPGTTTFGRTAFYIHGDSVEFPGLEEASHGCIILSRPIRELIAASPDRYLEVE